MQELTKEYLEREYIEKKRSFSELAKELNTYPNKLIRLAKKLGIEIRSASDAQKEHTNKHGSNFAGKSHSDETRYNISEKKAKHWKDMSLEERQRLSQISKQNWDNMSDAEKTIIQKRAMEAIRQASVEGSKLELYIFEKLQEAGFAVFQHKKHLVANKEIHIDLLLPNDSIAIEIDGPSHFEPIWGNKQFTQAKKTDNNKTALLLGAGYCLIRLIQHRNLSQKFMRDVWLAIYNKITEIQKEFPPVGDRLITIKID